MTDETPLPYFVQRPEDTARITLTRPDAARHLSPGQVAYKAYWQVHKTDGLKHYPPPFDWLQAITQQSWEAAAQAVLALKEEEP